MGKEKVLTIRIDGSLRAQIDRCAKEDRLSASAVAKEAIRAYCERRNRQRLRNREVKKALAAFRRFRGAVSDESLSQNIDEQLYGPTG